MLIDEASSAEMRLVSTARMIGAMPLAEGVGSKGKHIGAGYGSGLSWRAEYARRDDDDRHAVLTTPPEKGLETGVEDDVCRAGPGLQFRSEVNSPSWILTLSQDLLTLGKAVAVGDHALKHLGERVSAGRSGIGSESGCPCAVREVGDGEDDMKAFSRIVRCM
jgi:hypothetical protein